MTSNKDGDIIFQPQEDFWNSLFPQEKLYYDTYLKEGYFKCEIIDECLYVKFENDSWELGYHFRYGPLDFGAVLEIERNATTIYALLKNEWPQYADFLFLNSYSQYPDNEISVGWNLNHLSNVDLFKIYRQAKFLNESLYFISRDQTSWDRDLFIIDVEDVWKNPLRYISFQDSNILRRDLDWLEIVLMLEYYNFHVLNDNETVYSRYSDGKGMLIISNILGDNDEIEAKISASTEIEFVVQLKDYILLKDHTNKYLCYPNLYELITKLVQMLDSWEDSKKIHFYITPQKEIVIYNEVFIGIQPIYILDNDRSKEYLVNQELSRIGTLIEEISGVKFVDSYAIIESFGELVMDEQTIEREIQDFLYNYYQILLGKNYTNIHTEVSVNYEDETEHRRIDIMVYDTTRADWDIYELKKGFCGKTVITTRGIPSFSSHVNKSLTQVYEYREMLKQREIRRQLEQKHNIRIKNPKYFLLIGFDDSENWYRCCSREKEVSIISYKRIIDLAKCSDRWTSISSNSDT